MGIRFKLEHASIVGWLARSDYPFGSTGGWDDEDFDMHYMFHRRHRRFSGSSDRPFPDADFESDGDGFSSSWNAPRVMLNVMRDFLEALPYSVVADDDRDRSALGHLANDARNRLDTYMRQEVELFADPEPKFTEQTASRAVLPSHAVAKILMRLRG